MPRLSIVVPFMGNLSLLEDTLVSVLENRPKGCQVVVVLNEGYDDPYELHKEVSFVASRPDAGLVGGIYRGLLASEAPVVHVLACGMAVAPGWTDAAMPHFDDPQVGAVAPLVLSAGQPHRVVSAGLRYKCSGRVRRLSEGRLATRPPLRRQPCGPDARAAFYRRSALAAVAQWNEGRGLELMGIDLALALRHQGFRCELEPDCRVFAQGALTLPPAAFRTGVEEARLFWRWASRCGWRRSVASHAAMLLTECLTGLLWPRNAVRAAGRMAGGLGSAFSGRRDCPVVPAGGVPGPHFACPAAPRQLAATTASRRSGASNFSEACSSGPAAPRRAPG
ncbi:MAG: glycosyltransferase family 2 protein [Thermoguttaceae bacterium]|nr:glycosyltransferase family 2 protein [Thermoguttaceae bacterium]